MMRLVGLLLVVLASCPRAGAQSLFLRPVPTGPVAVATPVGSTVQDWSLLHVAPPAARQFAVHDLVTIIVDEVSSLESRHKLETDKSYDVSGKIGPVLDPWQLLELRLRAGGISDEPLLRAAMERQFEGEGRLEREDRFQARIQAEVIDVKPNGTLVLEARKTRQLDDDRQTMVLSGRCRAEDVTSANTILSSQLADLTLAVRNEGELRTSTKRGLIPRVLDAVLAF